VCERHTHSHTHTHSIRSQEGINKGQKLHTHSCRECQQQNRKKGFLPNNLQLFQAQTDPHSHKATHPHTHTQAPMCVYLFPLQMSLLCAQVTKSLRLKRICMWLAERNVNKTRVPKDKNNTRSCRDEDDNYNRLVDTHL